MIWCCKNWLLSLVLMLGAPAYAVADMTGHGGPIRAIHVSPDGSKVLTASFDFTARLYDFVEQRELAVLDAHEGPVNVAVFHPDGDHGVTGGDDGMVYVWALSPPQMVLDLKAHEQKVTSLDFSPDGHMFATGGWDARINVWNFRTGERIRSIETYSPVNTVQILSDGDRVAAGLKNGNIRIWRISDGRSLAELNAHELGVLRLVTSTDGTRMLSAGANAPIKLWDLADYSEMASYKIFDGNTSMLAISPSGQTALVADRYGFIYQFDLATGGVLQRIKAHDGPVWAVSFARNETFALSGGIDEVVRVWHLATSSRISFGDEDTVQRPTPWLDSDHPGARIFRKCAGCHATTLEEPARSGPHFVNLFGRAVGSVQGYRYSQSLVDADFTWNDRTLAELFTQGPDVYLPGTKMPVQKFVDDSSLMDLIDYLHILTSASVE